MADEIENVSPAARALVTADARRLGRRYWVMAGSGVVLVLVAILLATRSSKGTLVVSISDANGTAVPSAEVTIDGVRRCRASPCKLEDLNRGTHLVQVAAVGYKRSEQKAEVESGTRTQLSVSLVAEPPETTTPTPAVAAEALSEADDEESTESKTEKPSMPGRGPGNQASSKSTGRTTGASAADKEVGPVTDLTGSSHSGSGTGKGYLTVTSEPSGMVSIDGKPIGPSPRGINLPAGPHTITVENPDYGKQTVKVIVQGGKSSSVMLNL